LEKAISRRLLLVQKAFFKLRLLHIATVMVTEMGNFLAEGNAADMASR
jgi:hypothetical protein